jgi:hypothetical protein
VRNVPEENVKGGCLLGQEKFSRWKVKSLPKNKTGQNLSLYENLNRFGKPHVLGDFM